MKRRAKKPAKARRSKVTRAKPLPYVPKATSQEVKVGKAKGRPMLVWVGKRPLNRVTAFPAQLAEMYNPTAQTGDWDNLLFHGDNKEVLAWMLANGMRSKVNLIYIDPPFDSGADYVRKVRLRGVSGSTKLEGESYTLGEQIQYTDIWANDNYLQFMYERLILLRELLADGGAIFLHCDSTKGHHLRCLMDEVFGPERFVNEIVWSYRRWPSNTPAFQSMHDTILYYVAGSGENRTFHQEYEKASESYAKRFGGKTQKLDEESGTRKITLEEETKGMPLRDVWEMSIVAGFKGERTQYPTQKPEELLRRIIEDCSNPGDLVLDCFIGSGTTASVAQKLGRKWIGCDINKGAIQTTVKRLQAVIEEQCMSGRNGQQGKLAGVIEDIGTGKPASLMFSVFRVNDYDLQIQHNEAVNLACEHMGVERTYTDRYFEGKLGKRLVKIVPFNHPLSPLDLEEMKNELKARPQEDRNITIVCLGKEAACDAWLEDWNRMRRQSIVPNQIEVIELRTDPKYGKFFIHNPARADVKISRQKDKIVVDIKDFLSPTIIERLSSQDGVLRPQITDWRSMVDTVMIDPAYNGEVFNIALADVPERKSDLVEGCYELNAPKRKTTVAVKITDMLGEEVLVTHET